MRTTLTFITNLIFLIGFCVNANSQMHIDYGIDLAKTPTNNLIDNSSGIVIEPIFIAKFRQSNLRIKSIIGYASIKRDNIFVNSNMEIKGFYWKGGVGYSDSKKVAPYLNLCLSTFNVSNKFGLKGNYFGDYERVYNHNNRFTLGLEPNCDIHIRIYNKISMLISLRLSLLLINTSYDNYPIYYIPGAGIINNKYVTTGVSLYLMFNDQ